MAVGCKRLRDKICHGSSEPEIEKAEVSDDHPGDRQYAEPVGSKRTDQSGNGDDPHSHWGDLSNEVPNRIAREQRTARQFRHLGIFDRSRGDDGPLVRRV